MKSVFILAKITFQEMVREKFFLVVAFMAVLLLGISLLLGSLSFAEQKRILVDLGFGAIEISALGIALFSGSFVISKEVEKQTCLLLLSKPLSRDQFFIGKWLGLTFLITVTHFALCAILFLLLQQFEFLFPFALIALSIWFKILVMLSLVFLISGLVRPIFALLFGMTVYLLGHWLSDLEFFVKKSQDQALQVLFKIVHEVTPQFYRFNWKSYPFLEKGVPMDQIGALLFYMSAWIVLMLVLAVTVFRRKDIV